MQFLNRQDKKPSSAVANYARAGTMVLCLRGRKVVSTLIDSQPTKYGRRYNKRIRTATGEQLSEIEKKDVEAVFL